MGEEADQAEEDRHWAAEDLKCHANKCGHYPVALRLSSLATIKISWEALKQNIDAWCLLASIHWFRMGPGYFFKSFPCDSSMWSEGRTTAVGNRESTQLCKQDGDVKTLKKS